MFTETSQHVKRVILQRPFLCSPSRQRLPKRKDDSPLPGSHTEIHVGYHDNSSDQRLHGNSSSERIHLSYSPILVLCDNSVALPQVCRRDSRGCFMKSWFDCHTRCQQFWIVNRHTGNSCITLHAARCTCGSTRVRPYVKTAHETGSGLRNRNGSC